MKTDNELIAEFMGGVHHPPSAKAEYWELPHGVFVSEHLQYDKRWDWLMPVVEKIETLSRLEVNDGTKPFSCCIIREVSWIEEFPSGAPVVSGTGETKLQSLYDTVVKFIKWYNGHR